MALYGDDWISIYRYLTHFDTFAQINTFLPGPFIYLAPYGPSVFFIGKGYELFGHNYFFYFLISLIFKIFASFSLFVVCRLITKSLLISILSAILFLSGYTGIQTTDWVFYSNVYLGVGLFFLGFYSQLRFLEESNRRNLIWHFVLSALAIIAAPVRLYPLVFVIPVIDVLFLGFREFLTKKEFLFKNIFFALIIVSFLLIGVFGEFGGKIYSPGNWSVNDFISFSLGQPQFVIKSLFYWVGVIAIPNTVLETNRAFF